MAATASVPTTNRFEVDFDLEETDPFDLLKQQEAEHQKNLEEKKRKSELKKKEAEKNKLKAKNQTKPKYKPVLSVHDLPAKPPPTAAAVKPSKPTVSDGSGSVASSNMPGSRRGGGAGGVGGNPNAATSAEFSQDLPPRFSDNKKSASGPVGGRRGGGHRGGFGSAGPIRDGTARLDRRSADPKTGVKAVLKKEGGGSFNWGHAGEEVQDINDRSQDQLVPVEEDADAANKSAGDGAGGDGPAEAGLTDTPTVDGDEYTLTEEEIAEAREMTLDEYKQSMSDKLVATSSFNIRKAGEGEDSKQWGNTKLIRKKSGGDTPIAAMENHLDDSYEGHRLAGKMASDGPVLTSSVFGAPPARPRGGGGRGGRGGPRGRGGRGGYNRFDGSGGRFKESAPALNDANFPDLPAPKNVL